VKSMDDVPPAVTIPDTDNVWVDHAEVSPEVELFQLTLGATFAVWRSAKGGELAGKRNLTGSS